MLFVSRGRRYLFNVTDVSAAGHVCRYSLIGNRWAARRAGRRTADHRRWFLIRNSKKVVHWQSANRAIHKKA